MTKSYAEKRLDPRWQKRRLEVFEWCGWQCVSCTRKDRTLHVHHAYYVQGREPWEYPNGALWSLCETCHEEFPDFGIDLVERFLGLRLWVTDREFGGAPGSPGATLTLESLPEELAMRLLSGEVLDWRAFVDMAAVAARFAEAVVAGADAAALRDAFDRVIREEFGIQRDRLRESLDASAPPSGESRKE